MTVPSSSERTPTAIDPRPRQLLERYASLIGALLMDVAEDLVEFEVPVAELRFWAPAKVVRIALVPEALEEDPNSELLGIGSPVFDRLIAAVRNRGFLHIRGLIPPSEDSSPEAARLPVSVEGASVAEGRSELTLLPLGRLLARVSVRAGSRLEERIVESPAVNLSTGALLPPQFTTILDGSGVVGTPPGGVGISARRPAGELLQILFSQLEGTLANEIGRLREDSERARNAEVERLERYYGAMLAEVEPDDDPEEVMARKLAIDSELKRRRDEETDRSRVRVTVHPLQLTEWQILAQTTKWQLVTDQGLSVPLEATRLLTGETAWRLNCPACGAEPESVRVCKAGHASCSSCSQRCGVCGETSCRAHGLALCAAEGHAVCAEHARICNSCGAAHCSVHSGRCAATDHEMCPSCVVACAHCGKGLCQAHASQSNPSAPRGARWLCPGCTVLCEGGANEVVGVDEVVRCTSCERHICETHQVTCAVDGQTHCSRHLRRSDRSGRLVCEAHRALCIEEPKALFASDEVVACATCGKMICETHGGTCDSDETRHCLGHLSALFDGPGRKGCAQHRTTCHIDGISFSMTGTKPCPVCGKPACEAHRTPCLHCARQVCAKDITGAKCVTCSNLEELSDPGDDLIQAALAANGGEPPKAKTWWSARDSSGVVVQLDLGWTRRLVFSVPHGDVKPKTVMQHSALGSKRLR